MLVKYFFFVMVLIAITAGFLVLDGYLKTLYAQRNPDIAREARLNMEAQAKDNALSFGFVPDFTAEEFDPIMCVNWTHLIHFALIEIILIGKCVAS